MLAGEITVSAAASLTESFTRIGRDFEGRHPGTTVHFNFGSSGTLATQLLAGAPADVFASADTTNMDELVQAKLLDGMPATFASNRLAIVTPPGNPSGIATLADLADHGVVSLCASTAPCGRYADQILSAAHVAIPAERVTRGQNVKATLSAVTSGDATAAIVYVSDAKAAGAQVDSVSIPDTQNVVATYPIATVASSANPRLATAFAEFVLGSTARAVLVEAGFLAP